MNDWIMGSKWGGLSMCKNTQLIFGVMVGRCSVVDERL